jgi:excisionase family DNA binding protein
MSAQFLTTFQAAKMCHVSPGSVVRWIREGKLPASMTAGGHHRIALEDLLKFLKKLRMPVPAEFEHTEARCRSLVVSSNPKNLKQILKMLKSRFPGAVIEERT